MGGADELFGSEQAQNVSGADALFSGEEAQNENRLKFVMDETIDETPERAARALEIQKKTGVPKKFIDENFDELDKADKQADFDPKQFTKSNPKIADWLSRNPDYAPLLREDIETMGALEQSLTKASDYLRSIGRGAIGQGAGTTLSGAGELYGVATRAVDRGLSAALPENVMEALRSPTPWWIDPEQILKRPGEELKEFGERIAPPIERQGIDTDIASGIGQLGFQIATALIAGPTSAVTTMLTQGADIMAEKTAKDDADQASKDVAILAGASITAITEKFGLDMILSRVPPAIKSTVLRQIADISIAGGIEAAQEFTEGLLHDVTRKLLTNADAPMLENIDREMIAAGGAAAIVRAAVNATLGVRVRNDYKERAKLQEDFFKSLGDNAESAKIRERLPDTYQEIIKDITKDGPVENVYTPVEFFQSHFQEQGIDPRQIATELGFERQYDEAVNTGGKIAIPLDVYANNLAPTEHNAVFAKELSFGPDQMSARETEEFLKEAEKEKEPETDAFAGSLEQAMTPIREQLNAIYPADVADKNAAVIEARLRTRSQRLGVDPQQLMKERPISIVEGGAETQQESVLNQLAYHGSPYKFQRFDMSKIGTGEGAQAYGHGLYFAESTGVATSYSKLGKIAEIGGVPVSGKGVSASNLDAAQKLGINKASLDRLALSDFDVKRTLTELGEEYNSAKTIGDKSYLMQQIGDLKRLMKSDVEVKGGNLYKVDISDDSVKNFLDWDKPLSEQTESVRKATSKLWGGKAGKHLTGKDVYLSLAMDLSANKQGPEAMVMASDRLKSIGIQGIRYLDQGSREAGKGSSNFVVFDDSIINILDVNGEPVSKQEQKKIVDAMHSEGELFQSDVKKQTDTPEFRKWFKDSKVVDENGEPLVVYHGTASTDISEFRPQGDNAEKALALFREAMENNERFGYMNFRWGSFFSPHPDYAGNYTAEDTGVMYPVYIKAENPIYFDQRTGNVTGVDPNKTPDALIMMDGDVINEVAVIDPKQVKSAIGNRGTFDPNDPNILYQAQKQTFDQTQTEPFKRWANDAPLVRSAEADSFQFKTGKKVVAEAFHGTARPDRVGTTFKRSRATSGPMAFFTSDPALASSYAQGKQDTSLSMEDQNYNTWFKYKPKGERTATDIDRAWYRLDQETKKRISELAPRVQYDDNGENIILGPETNKSGIGSYDYELDSTKTSWDRNGNPLKALVESWLNSGRLYNDEQRFTEVLKLSGFPTKDVIFDSPQATYPFVYKAYVAMWNPLVTSDIPENVIAAIESAAKRDRSRRAAGGADLWDKNTRTIRDWLAYYKESPEYAWTSIPDKVTAILKNLGYDGIVDKSGKGGGPVHPVYIPFAENQIKSAIGNKGTFSIEKKNILQQGAEVKRGSISVSPTGDVIRLFQAKNLSTLLHELSHRWLFEMQDDANLPDAPQQIKDDLAATLKYLGVESVEELDITRLEKGTEAYAKAVAANEKFAQTGEAYLMDGKAPSTALRRVFAQIRAWLVAVYKALKQGRLDVDLTPEMRGVFDRLLATDQEIEAAKAEANAAPIFTTSVDAGMTDTEFSAYRKTIEDANREEREELDAKVMNEYKKTLTDLWKEEKAKVQAEVEAELDIDPVYAAMAKMKENDLKIARSEAGSLPRSLTAKDGIPADMAAEMLGFTSGEALVKALASVEARGARVARETNIRMDQRFGSLLTDGRLVEEARKAVMGDGRAKIIEAEIKALNKKAREVKPFVKAKEKAKAEQERAGRDLYKSLVPKLADVREHAAAVIAGKPIRELRPMQYYNAARQASREAINDVRKKDYLMAGYNKGRELLNLELYRAAVKAQDMIEDGNQKLQKVFVSDIKQSKSRNMDMVNAARAILASHGLGKTEAAPSTYLDKMRQYDPEIYENLRPIFDPAIASMKPYKDMTVEEYIGMRDAVLALMKTSRRSKQIEIDGKLMDRDEAVANLVNRLMDFDKGKSKALKSTLDDMQKTKIGLLSAKAALRRVESWITAMDGGKDGVFRKFIWNPVSDAVNLYRDKKREVVSRYLEIVQQVAPTIKPGDIEAPELGFKFRGKNELLHALLHTGNESNKAKLLIGYGWGERSEEGVLDTSKWDAFEKRMRDQGILTKADYDFAQNVWDMMEGMKPALQEAHHRMYGYYFNEVTANEFSNEFGTYRGGYVPAKVDVNVVQEAEQRKDAEEIVQGQNSFAFPTSGKGATMSRVESYARPLQLDMRTIPAHIDWAMRFAYLEPAVKDVARVVLDKDFAKSMNGLDPTTINHMLVPWLQRTAQQLTSTRGMNKWVDKFWTGVRGRSGMQVMVLNVINTLQQYTGLTIAFTRVKPSNIRSAFWMYMTNHKGFSEEISEKSSFMRNRVFTSHNEVMQTIDDLLLNPSKYEKAKDFATKHGYFMQQATQGFVDQVVWKAAYDESLSNGQSDKDSVRHADSVVRETQGSFAPEDISRFEAGTPFVRAFSMFYNYFNMQANLLGTEAANIASNELGLRKGAGRALYVYTFAFMIPAYIGGAIIRALVAGGLDEDDDDEYMDDLIRLFFSSQFEAATATVPVVGQLLNTAVNQWNKKWYDDKITVSPAVSAVESAVRAPYSVYKSIVDDGNEKRAVKDTLSLIGMATGLPVGALGRPLGYLADVHQGKAQPENAMDVARGLISGQDVNRSR